MLLTKTDFLKTVKNEKTVTVKVTDYDYNDIISKMRKKGFNLTKTVKLKSDKQFDFVLYFTKI